MTIFLYLLSAACFVYAFFAFWGKGPILSTFYAVATKEEKNAMKTPSLYKLVAGVFLIIGLMLLLAGLGIQFQKQWLFTIVILTGILLILFIVAASIYTEVKKSK